MTQGKRKTWVIGHKNPDTDSICAAIAYADLKNQTEDGIFIPKRAGHMNEETKYVLKFFALQIINWILSGMAFIFRMDFRQDRPFYLHFYC